MQLPLFERRDYAINGKDTIENNFDALSVPASDELVHQMKYRKSNIDFESMIRKIVSSQIY